MVYVILGYDYVYIGWLISEYRHYPKLFKKKKEARRYVAELKKEESNKETTFKIVKLKDFFKPKKMWYR